MHKKGKKTFYITHTGVIDLCFLQQFFFNNIAHKIQICSYSQELHKYFRIWFFYGTKELLRYFVS